MAHFLIVLVKTLAALPCALLFLLLCYAGFMGGKPSTFSEIVFDVILISGLIPLIAWITLIFKSTKKNLLKLLTYAISITLLHYVVAVFQIHRHPFYWWIQTMELASLWILSNTAKNNKFTKKTSNKPSEKQQTTRIKPTTNHENLHLRNQRK